MNLQFAVINKKGPRMDFLNKAFAQVADLFRSMTPGARLTAGLLLIVVVVSLGYLFTHDMSGPSADLMHGVPIPPGQMSAMEAAFGKAKLTGYKIDGDADQGAARPGGRVHGRLGRSQGLAGRLQHGNG